MLDFFLVENVSQEVLTLTNRDRHLDVATCISFHGTALSITSSVRIHSAFGRVYMIPVAPIHRLIVRKNLKQIPRQMRAAARVLP